MDGQNRERKDLCVFIIVDMTNTEYAYFYLQGHHQRNSSKLVVSRIILKEDVWLLSKSAVRIYVQGAKTLQESQLENCRSYR